MLEVERETISSEQILYLYDRLYFKGRKVYVPDIVAHKYGFIGKKLSCRDVKELLLREWNRTSRLFRRYALSDCKRLAFIFLFP
jgi:hypothetical protein